MTTGRREAGLPGRGRKPRGFPSCSRFGKNLTILTQGCFWPLWQLPPIRSTVQNLLSELASRFLVVCFSMAASAEGYKVLLGVVPELAPRNHVVDFQFL
jgi:hypothetical protein